MGKLIMKWTMVDPEDTLKFDTAEDFGFSTMELSAVRALPEVTADLKDGIGKALTAKTRADARTREMYEAIMPLINNLLKDADKNPYIHWPNRVDTLKSFKEKLQNILDKD